MIEEVAHGAEVEQLARRHFILQGPIGAVLPLDWLQPESPQVTGGSG